MIYAGTLALSRANLADLAAPTAPPSGRSGAGSSRPACTARAGHLRNGDTYTRLVQGFAIRVATVFRYVVREGRLTCSRSLTAALWRLPHNGH